MRKSNINEKIFIISNFCKLDKVEHYLKINIIQAFLEMLVSLYLLMTMIFLTKHFFEFENVNLLYLVVGPIFLSFLICVAYSFFLIYLIIDMLYSIVEPKKVTTINAIVKKAYRRLHFTGWFSYIASSFFVSLLVLHSTDVSPKCDSAFFILIVTTLGAAFGFIWNILGYCCDYKVAWDTIFKLESAQKLFDEWFSHDYYLERNRFYKMAIVFHTIVYLMISCELFAIVINLNIPPDGQHFFGFELLVTLFVSLLILYTKTIFDFYFGKTNKEHRVHYNIVELSIILGESLKS